MTATLAPVRRLPAHRVAAALPACLYAATVLAQIAFPLTAAGGTARDRLTVVVVLVAAAAAVAHAVVTTGARGAAGLAVVAVVGLAAEAVGVATGFPFGTYAYAGTLGPEIAGVPWLVVAAWVSMAWPAAVVARLLAQRLVSRVALGAVGLAAWDVFLDPQMVTAGHWTWAGGGWRLPGIQDVPVTNFAGWLGVAAVIAVVLQAVPPPADLRSARLPAWFFVWTAASSALAAGAFWGRPAVAAWGLLAMGPLAGVTARRLLRR